MGISPIVALVSQIPDSEITRPPADATGSPHIANARGDDDHQIAVLEPPLLFPLDDVDDAILLTDVSIVGVVNALLFRKAQPLEHIAVGRRLA